MGRIKSKFIKKAGKKIFDKGLEDFATEFKENKEVIKQYAKFNSKKLRNVVVGYITRLKKNSEEKDV